MPRTNLGHVHCLTSRYRIDLPLVDRAWYSAVCGETLGCKQMTHKPTHVTCPSCLKWLSRHVGYFNFLLAHERALSPRSSSS